MVEHARILKGFTLVNRRWAVKIVSAKTMKARAKGSIGGRKGKLFGLCDPDRATIYLTTDGVETQAFLEHTFWHEYVHAIYYAEGMIDEHDEIKVERLAGFLHQSLGQTIPAVMLS